MAKRDPKHQRTQAYGLGWRAVLAGCLMLVACASNTPKAAVSAGNDDCAALAGLRLQDGAVDTAMLIQAGQSWRPPGAPIDVVAPKSFCRIRLSLQPVARSNIHAELWLP